jgi:DNA-binding Lrp family transcriptional regulator
MELDEVDRKILKILQADGRTALSEIARRLDMGSATIHERVETLESKISTQEAYSGEEPEKLDHLAARPMNELMDLGPNTAHMNQKPQNPFSPGDRVVKAEDDDPDVAVVVEVLPPEKDENIYGQTMEGEAVRVAFPSALDRGPGDWREYHPALLASYCYDQSVKLYSYESENLKFAENPYTPGARVVKVSHDDPDVAVVIDPPNGDSIRVVYAGQLGDDYIAPSDLASHCEENQIKVYSYSTSDLAWAE